jgi:hypothetical protein
MSFPSSELSSESIRPVTNRCVGSDVLARVGLTSWMVATTASRPLA